MKLYQIKRWNDDSIMCTKLFFGLKLHKIFSDLNESICKEYVYSYGV